MINPYIDQYLELLARDVYPERPTVNHVRITQEAFEHFVLPRREMFRRVLDIGCGQGVALELFVRAGIPAEGVTLGQEDVQICQQRGFNVSYGDQSYLEWPEGTFDLLWSRHCLEHSVMPLLTLFEYNRVTAPGGYLYVEVPQPESLHIDNPNHYSLFSDRGWRSLFRRAQYVVEDFRVYNLSYKWPNGVRMEDYYYGYWLKKTASILEVARSSRDWRSDNP